MSTIPTQNPVPSEAAKDLKFNSGKIDEFVTSMKNKYIDRFGQEHFTIEGLRWVAQQAISQFGYITLDSFQKGAEITLPNQVLRDEVTGEYYRWDGELPKSVPVNSTPDSSGGVGVGSWLSVGDATLRGALSQAEGYKLIGGLFNLINPYDLTIENINKTPLDSAIELRNKSKKILRFATNNLWTHYSTETWFNGDLTSPRKTMLLKKLWLMVSADVWGFQEVFTSPIKDISMFLIPPYNNAFFTETISPIKNLGFSYGVGCMTRLNCTHSGGVYLSPPSDLDSEVRGFNVLFLDNDILFINTHLSTDPSRSKQMIIELADLVTSFSKNKVVIVGDFNTRNIDDFKPLENIGFEIVNKDTWLDIDKILIRNLNIVNTGMIDIIGSSAWNHLSDHNLYFVDVEV
ncbi:endonuclease/exonuclease/phosphatase family protein [Proteus mirabilis]|uniref:tail fiber/spike domain-containing protein n=1 Tax=Proteus mirabilis TaxID=584 RepID=UPI00028334DF|nr:hypothetical protein HMPREF1311_00815 [Proteus mirabilis WGLW6]HEK0546150.1 endonuclease/exonuclease/phosphatase family protein [Proteus mirabilis]HEK0705615.1 endonuclease/exonuclease/phosphatase family protein [Proteus mirabilis]